VATVAADNDRVAEATIASDAGTWINDGGGGGVADEPDIVYSGTTAQSRKVSTSLIGRAYSGGTTRDATATDRRHFLFKLNCTNYNALNTRTTPGTELKIGSDASNYDSYYVWGSDNYPNAGGWTFVPISINVAGYRPSLTTGSPTRTAIDYYSWLGDYTATAKAENHVIDAIDLGRGLKLTGGTPDGTFAAFLAADEGTQTNRWGYVRSINGIYFVNGELAVGENTSETAVATTFTDATGQVLVWGNGMVETGYHRFRVNLGNASTAVTITGATFDSIGKRNNDGDRGYTTTEDSRLVVVVTGTAGSLDLIGVVFKNLASFTATSATTVTLSDIEAALIVQGSADISDTIFRTTSLTTVAALQDPTFGTTTDLHDVEFVQAGAGHAIELDTATTYTFTNLQFTGYGGTPGSNGTPSSGASDAAIVNSSGGAVTINISGGDVPSVRNTAGSTTTVVATVNYTINNIVNPSEVTVLDRDVSLLDITGTPSNQNVGDVTANTKVGQSFQVTSAGKVERVRLNLRKVGTPTDGLRIRLVNGVPGSTELLVSSYIDGADLTTSYVEFDVDLNGKSSLATSTTYGIEIERSGANDGSNYYQVEYDTTSVHASGARYLNNGTWGSTTGDLLLSIMEAASDNVLYHVESVTSGTTTYSHGGTSKTIEVLVFSLSKKPVVYLDTISGTDKSQAVSQVDDLVYSNP